jgi:hypothetical protein
MYVFIRDRTHACVYKRHDSCKFLLLFNSLRCGVHAWYVDVYMYTGSKNMIYICIYICIIYMYESRIQGIFRLCANLQWSAAIYVLCVCMCVCMRMYVKYICALYTLYAWYVYIFAVGSREIVGIYAKFQGFSAGHWLATQVCATPHTSHVSYNDVHESCLLSWHTRGMSLIMTYTSHVSYNDITSHVSCTEIHESCLL